MTIPNVVLNQFITVPWGNAVADSINRALHGGQAIIELATTPVGSVVNELQWSTTHQALMRWTGTQWVFAQGPPPYLTRFEGLTQNNTTAVQAGEWLVSPLNTGAVVAIGGTLGRAGGVSISSNALTNSGGSIATAAQSLTGGNPGLRFRSVFQVPAGVTSAETSRQGLHDSVTQGDAQNGCYLEITNSTASFKTAHQSVRTTNATTATLLNNVWYTLHIWFLTGGTFPSARCVLMKDDGTLILDVTNSGAGGNVPVSGRLFRGSVVATSFPSSSIIAMLNIDSVGVGFNAI